MTDSVREALWDNKTFSPLKQRTLELAYQHVVPGRVQTLLAGGVPFVMGRREGYRIWDVDGHELMDFHLNGGTFNLGHRNPVLVEVLRNALDELDIGNHHFPSVERAALADQLCALAPGDMPYVVFASGGSEAVDIAIKSARRATGRRVIVTIDSGYHGGTGFSGAAGNDDNARYFGTDRPDEFVKVPFNDLDALEKALNANEVAAVMIETIPATCGFPIPDQDYLPGAARLAREYGALYIADEVQTGLGRTGRLWGVQNWGVEPDLMITGKGLSGGIYPMAAVLLSSRSGQWLHENGWGHVSTFGGSELGCRVAAKVLEICAEADVLNRAASTADYLRGQLAGLSARYPYLAEVRSCGLVMGLKFGARDGALRMMAALYAHGLWAIYAGFDASILQFKPGLLVDRAYCDTALERFEGALKTVSQ